MDFINSTEGILLFSVIGLVIFCWIMFEIIKAGSFGKKIYIEAQKQTRLMSAMAQKNGVDEGTISAILEDTQYWH